MIQIGIRYAQSEKLLHYEVLSSAGTKYDLLVKLVRQFLALTFYKFL